MPDGTSTSDSSISVEQTNNQIGGDNAGRDITKNLITIATSPTGDSHPAAAFISRLAQKYRKEKETNSQFRQTVERLEHYQAATGPTMTLEEKLQQGGRGDLIEFALKTKEMFAKKLAKHSLYESAQQIHAFLLAEVYTRYHEHVYQHVCKNDPPEVINALGPVNTKAVKLRQ
ncbi:MAG TPA: ABC-three component system protein [Verrucomicrobiae bacterium]|jgi:hypothetical protein|nr:ABC-three component system protein [Verrucomicrobiae bacterium]